MKEIEAFEKDIEALITQKLSRADHFGHMMHEVEQHVVNIKYEL